MANKEYQARKSEAYEPVTDEEFNSIIDTAVHNATGDWLNSADMSREREKSTFEYGMKPIGHLSPQGVSQIVSSDTVEAVEGFLALISELMLDKKRIAKFLPLGKTPTDISLAKTASDLVNYVIFKQNPGWALLNTWIKAALMWKNSVIRWDYVDDSEYKIEEYDKLEQPELDFKLAEPNVEIVSESETKQERKIDEASGEEVLVECHYDVKLRRKVIKSRIKIDTVDTEAFRISRNARTVQSADFVGIQIDMDRSEVRDTWPDAAEGIEDWDRLATGEQSWYSTYSVEKNARQKVSGQATNTIITDRPVNDAEALQPVTVIECWVRADRDGDGIAELLHVVRCGPHFLVEEAVDRINIAVLCPFEIPFEFEGLSVADMARPSTLATTAILRGFVENVYMTNYSPKLADPNVVDFSALQNMKPKQVIPTNGNPTAAVHALTPETISQGTVPLLEFLQMHKEQAHGMSKAAQGLNDTLYVSGNSEEKLQKVMSASQVRIQYMVRRFAETGFQDLIDGIYAMLRDCLAGEQVNYFDNKDYLRQVDPASLPPNMLLVVDVDVGDNSNSSRLKKLSIVKQTVDALQSAGAGGAVKPEAAVKIACQVFEALDMDPLDYMEDYTQPDFIEKAKQAREGEIAAKEKMRQLEERIKNADLMQREATIALTNIQNKNALQDNMRQMLIAMDTHYQQWAEITVKATKEDANLPVRPDLETMWKTAMQFISMDASSPVAQPTIEAAAGPAAEATQELNPGR